MFISRLTTGTDTFVGGVGDDTVTANVLTLGAGDSVTDATTTDNDTINITSNTGTSEKQTVTITYSTGSATDVVTINGYAVSFTTGANQSESAAALTAAVNATANLTNKVVATNNHATVAGEVILQWSTDGAAAISVDTTSTNNTNTVALVTAGTATVTSGTTITKIENINVKSLGDTTVDMANITGVKSFTTAESTGAIIVNNASSATMALGFSGQFNNTVTVNYASGLAGSDDNIVMTVNSAKDVTANVTAGFERASLALNGTANTITGITTPGSALTISGSGDAVFAANALVGLNAFTITNTEALKFGAIQTKDLKTLTATANTGGIAGSTALATGNIYSTDTIDGDVTGLTMFLGAGADNLLINEQAGAGKTNTLMLGAGNDIADLVNAGAGATYVFGEAGNDHIRVKTTALEATDLISGGTGTDTLTLTGNLVHNLALASVEYVNLEATTGAKTTVLSADTKVVFTTNAVANDSVDLAGLVAGSSVVVNANASTTALIAEVDAIDVAFTLTEAVSTIDVNTAQDGPIKTTNIAALTLNFAEIVGATAQSDIDITAGTSLAIVAAKDITFDDVLAGSELLTSLSVTASDKVTIDDLLNDAVLTTVSITATDDIDLGKITDADKLTSITLTSTAGLVVVDEIGDNSAVTTDADNLTTVSLSAATTVTAGIIEADVMGNVTMTATNGLLTVTKITSLAAMGTVALTASAGGVKIDTGDIVAADTTGITVNMAASTFINVTGLTGGAKADVTNSKGDIASTLSGAAAATINYSAGTANTGASSGSVTLLASNTGGLVTTVTNNELVGEGASAVTLSASSHATVNLVTLLGYSATTNVTGSIGADSIINSNGGNLLTSDSTNSNDTYALGNGVDTLSYAGNTHGTASGTASAGATTNAMAMR